MVGEPVGSGRAIGPPRKEGRKEERKAEEETGSKREIAGS